MISSFRTRYAPPRPPEICVEPVQAIPLTNAGLRLLGQAPAVNVQMGSPPRHKGDGTNGYLWVIDDNGISYIQEIELSILQGNLTKHTNLTAGGCAYIGGELWFSNHNSIYVSGASGRYPPRDAGQLEAAVEVFRSFGYCVKSLGWDTDTDKSERYLKP